MDVAIMGAGMSGLSCAITLERHGVQPVIFEKRSRVGDRFVNGEATFSLLNRPIKDELRYLKEKYDIHLIPTGVVNKLVFHSKNEVGSIEGALGYLNIRGRHEDAYECQLERQVRSGIHFNSTCEYEQLRKDFEYVVLAPGDGAYAEKLGNFRCDLSVTIKGATVTGEFLTSMPHVWFNYDVIPRGYAWLLPYSETEANLVLAYPDTQENIQLDLNAMWEEFYSMACRQLDQSLEITDRFEITRYMMGICEKPIQDKTYFVGNCFGAMSPGLGFGQFTSVLTGIYAAYDLLGLDSYDELSKPLFANYHHSLTLRRFLMSLTDKDLDLIVKNLDNRLLHSLIGGITSKESDAQVLKVLTPLMELWNTFKDE
jgi:flavin-dependent dehydrogenase